LTSMILSGISCRGENAVEPTGRGVDPDLSIALTHNSWSDRAPIPGALRYDVDAATIAKADGQSLVYVLGGRLRQPPNNPDPPATSILTYDVTTDAWASKSATLRAFETNGTGKIGNMLYVSGGRDFTGSPDDLVGQSRRLIAYDIVRDRVVRKSDMPVATGLGVTGVMNGKLYVLAGKCLNSLCQNFYRYDPVTNRWTSLAPSLMPHTQAGAAVLGGKLYVAGGRLRTSQGSFEVYDPGTNTWTDGGPLPFRRPTAVGATLNGKFYVIGTFGRRTTLAYNPAASRWTLKASFPFGDADIAMSEPSTAVRVTLEGVPRILTLGSSIVSGTEVLPAPSQMYTP
jgi:Kelch motif